LKYFLSQITKEYPRPAILIISLEIVFEPNHKRIPYPRPAILIISLEIFWTV